MEQKSSSPKKNLEADKDVYEIQNIRDNTYEAYL